MAYAAIVSLKQTLEGLLDSSRSRVHIPNLDLELIHDDLCHLKSFFDKLKSLRDSNRVEELEKSVKDVVVSTQDLIESHVSDIFHGGSERSGDESSISAFARDLMEFREKIGSLTKTMKGMDMGSRHTDDEESTGRFAADVDVTSRIDFGRDHKIVGLEDERMMLKQMMFGEDSSLTVIPIVGMGGIGKTTLAKAVFFDTITIQYFDIRLFVEIGEQYELKELLLRLLGDRLRVVTNELTVDELRMHLYKYLWGRRYLIVIDDIWNASVWDDLRIIFPNNRNGSSIILTTRLRSLVHYFDRARNIFEMRLLSEEESWGLLQEMTFPEDTEECPLELIEIGKTIARRLRGLPLAIVMVGKHLRMSETSVKNWMAVEENLSSHTSEDDISMVLKLSYTQLPQHLKACFLYLGLFPPDYSIPTSQVIKLWVTEGFIEPAAGESLEQKAQEYLEDLVLRSLVIVNEQNSRGKIKTCSVHSLFHDICVREARTEKLFHIVNDVEGIKNQRRLGFHSYVELGSKLVKSVSAARSLVFMCPNHPHHHELQVYLQFKWLRVLHALSFSCRKFPDKVLKLVRLRYLAITYDGELPSSISRLWNLEVLIIHRSQRIKITVSLPLEIWKLHKLRHLEYMGCNLPDPSTAARRDWDGCGMEKLLTLSGVSARSCTQGVLVRMPNLIKLGVWFEPTCDTADSGYSLTRLRHLESFKMVAMSRGLRPEAAAASSLEYFPYGLRKISLSGCEYPWEDMCIIAELPYLEVLKLRWNAFCGPEWETWEAGFCRLKFLLLEDLDVVQFRAESSHFPLLQQLLIRRCHALREIPIDLGDIPTLNLIEVEDCSMSLMKSANSILEEQRELGIEDLQVRISYL